MPLLTIAYPTLSETELAWIEGIRSEYDPQQMLIKPHFTLVFPTDIVRADVFVKHVQVCSQGQAEFTAQLRYAISVGNAFDNTFHVFLVPDEGLSQLWRLHDRLYTGPLAPALRLDIPFIPHITVAGGLTAATAQALAQRINQVPFALSARIDSLAAVDFNDGRLTTLAAYALL